ncbi:hypothetical protein ACIBP6_10005 [Nonomuraea terrae]|uniref:hypothetical protein n=1 Tax=Nonomuraea terrae TaxID=2530383 RepID=UPI00379FCF35
MTQIIAELLDRQEILKYLTGIADVEEESDVYDIDTDGWIETGDNGIAIEIDSERCLIKYELWDGAPPPLDSWDRSWSGSVRFASGKVCTLSDYDGNTAYGEESLGRRSTLWQVTIHRKALGHEEFTPDLVGVTLLKAQFWPAS